LEEDSKWMGSIERVIYRAADRSEVVWHAFTGLSIILIKRSNFDGRTADAPDPFHKRFDQFGPAGPEKHYVGAVLRMHELVEHSQRGGDNRLRVGTLAPCEVKIKYDEANAA
jgi:hypothetical protein